MATQEILNSTLRRRLIKLLTAALVVPLVGYISSNNEHATSARDKFDDGDIFGTIDDIEILAQHEYNRLVSKLRTKWQDLKVATAKEYVTI